jgi:uncharacterized SAM-binding protein YcdF (DUF218 family)
MSLSSESLTRGPPRPHRRRARIWCGVFALLAVMSVLGAGGWWERAPLLRSAARLWIVSDEPAAADVAAVLGGGIEDRPFAAAAYYRDGLVKKILVSGVRESRSQLLGVQLPHAAANRAVLIKLGVPEGDIEIFGAGLSNTRDEAVALRDWAAQHRVRSVLVPTEAFAARRLSWMLHRVFDDGTAVRVPALDPPDYRAEDWWKSENGVVAFQNEIIKYFYYRLRY